MASSVFTEGDDLVGESTGPVDKDVGPVEKGASQQPLKKYTEYVWVPWNSVGKIIGYGGTKITAICAKTNTDIRTPSKWEQPIFVVYGTKKDVGRAKQAILLAAEEFNRNRRPVQPRYITEEVHVPYRKVGAVIGCNGYRIRKLRFQTQTVIVTPKSENQSYFQVTGLPENVEAARREIEARIAEVVKSDTAEAAKQGTAEAAGDSKDVEKSDSVSCKSDLNTPPERLNVLPDVAFLSLSEKIAKDANQKKEHEQDKEGEGCSPDIENATGGRDIQKDCQSPPNYISRSCIKCLDKPITTALIPCGHNLFCKECAESLVIWWKACPACGKSVYSTLRLLSS